MHDYFKFLKFGVGRATDLACMRVRRGRLSRDEAIRLVRMHDGRFPHVYLGYPLAEVLSEINMSIDAFQAVCDRFTNRKVFEVDRRGNLVRDGDGSLVKANYDNMVL